MTTSEVLPRMYEDLANHFARQGETGKRDECLVLAAYAALSAGHPEDADRLRKRLLLTNPHHLLRPYSSMAEAILSADVCDYVADLQKQWPPETVAKMLNRPSPASVITRKKLASNARPMASEPLTAASYGLSMFVLTLGLAAALGLFLSAFASPFLE